MSGAPRNTAAHFAKTISGYFMHGFGEQAGAVVVGLGSLAWSGSNGSDLLSLAVCSAAILLWLLISMGTHPRAAPTHKGEKRRRGLAPPSPGN